MRCLVDFVDVLGRFDKSFVSLIAPFILLILIYRSVVFICSLKKSLNASELTNIIKPVHPALQNRNTTSSPLIQMSDKYQCELIPTLSPPVIGSSDASPAVQTWHQYNTRLAELRATLYPLAQQSKHSTSSVTAKQNIISN
jgi:hypothetical protein